MTAAPAPAPVPPLPPLVVRALETAADLRACVAVQREIWGSEFDEIVPPSLIRAALRVGAVALGAFAADGTLVGFVFGLTGIEDGEAVHWSHMLGVLPAARDRGVGRRLKELQRAEVARRGATRMYWTFDPLQARNAHLNLNVLGARVVEYVADMYGDSRSPLHQAVGTDRLIVEWLTDPAAAVRTSDGVEAAAVPVLTPFPRAGEADVTAGGSGTVWIEIPWDLQEVVATSAVDAREWREATRQDFQSALQAGYAVTRLHRDVARCRAFYVLERASER
jgi:predicted GNAT superfamily acetyltransferase